MSEARSTGGDRTQSTTDGPAVVTADATVQTLLDLLSDDACRSILAATTDAARSAREVASACDLPLSTTYRKLERLVDAGLLVEHTRVRPVGKHPSEFRRAVDEVAVTVGAGGTTRLVLFES